MVQILEGEQNILFSKAPIPVLVPTQTIQWKMGALSLGDKVAKL
jgi:hypothetical protein